MNSTGSEKSWRKWYAEDADRWHPQFSDALSAFRSAVETGQGGIDYFGRRWTFAELDRASDGLASWAAARGVGRGSRVSIVLQNVPGFAIAAVAAWKLGAIPVPSNPGYRARELAKIFADSTPDVVIAHADHSAEVDSALALAELKAPVLTVAAREHSGSPDPRVVDIHEPLVGLHPRLDDVIGGAETVPEVRAEGSDIGLLLYTSGTTGEPKGAVLRHSSIVWNAELMADWVGVTAESRLLGIAPMFHITGFVCHLLMAITKHCWLALFYRFDAAAVLDIIRRERPTYTVGAITAFNALASVPGVSTADFESFSEVYSGGAPVPPALQRSLRERLGVEIRNCYGMTETCAPTHMTPRGAAGAVSEASGALSIGVPVWHSDAKIVNDAGMEVAAGEVGELWLSGPQVMQGYWNKPAETAASLTDGWVHTGDVGYVDQDGWFFLIDRKKDMINASGFKVWPREVEDALYQHPAVREAAVVGEPDEYRGETVVAYVSLRPGAQVDSGELVAHCRKLLAAFKCPRQVHQRAELPKTVSGKILRRALREAQNS